MNIKLNLGSNLMRKIHISIISLIAKNLTPHNLFVDDMFLGQLARSGLGTAHHPNIKLNLFH